MKITPFKPIAMLNTSSEFETFKKEPVLTSRSPRQPSRLEPVEVRSSST